MTADGEPAETGVLNLLLELVDSTMTYRSRYKAIPQLPAVLDLVMADESNPRSLLFKIVEIEGVNSRAEGRTRCCDLGYLRTAYREESGRLGYRCAAEPIADVILEQA